MKIPIMKSSFCYLAILLGILYLSTSSFVQTSADVTWSEPLTLQPVDAKDVPLEFLVPDDRARRERLNQAPIAKPKQKSSEVTEDDDLFFQQASEIPELSPEEKYGSLKSMNLLDDPDDPVVDTLTVGTTDKLSLDSGSYHYYKYVAPSAGWPYYIHVIVTPEHGDPDLFMRVSNSSSDTTLPSNRLYTWWSTWGSGQVENIYILPTDNNACQPNVSTCTYYMAVYAYQQTDYAITVRTSDTATEMLNGLIYSNQYVAAGNYTYYFFYNFYPNTDRAIAFSVTALSGEPEIYIDDSVEFPTSENARWREIALGSNVVGLTQCNSDYYYIAVKGSHNRASRYSIMVHSYDPDNPTNSSTTLYLNNPVNDALVFDTWRYYTFHFFPYHDAHYLSVIASKRVGETDLYLNYYDDSSVDKSHFPILNSSQWSAIGDEGDHLITVQNPASGFYYIGVRAKTRNSQYLISVTAPSDNSTNLYLIDGYHYPGTTFQGQHNYYSFYVNPFYVNNDEDVVFIVSPRSGWGYMFVSDFELHPQYNNYSSYNFSTYIFEEAEIALSLSNGRLHSGYYYISVYGYTTNFTYTIAALATARATIYFGEEFNDHLSEDDSRFYSLSIPYKNSNAAEITLTVNSLYGYTRVYASPYPDPTSSNYYWGSETNGVLAQTVDIPSYVCNNIPSNATCMIYFQVNAVSDTTYTIWTYLKNSTISIERDEQLTGHVREGEYAFYQYFLNIDYVNVTITVHPTSGTPALYVARYSGVSADNYIFKADNDNGDKVVYFDYNSTQVQYGMTGYYYFAVFGKAASDFTIKVTRTDPVPNTLVDGKPQKLYLNTQDIHYYQFTAPSQGYPYVIQFSVTPEYGDPDLYVRLKRNANDNVLPNNNNYSTYDWDSLNPYGQVETVLIFPGSSPACLANTTTCTYYAAVFAWSYTSYYVLVRTGLTSTEVASGVATYRHYVANDEYQYYYFYNLYPNEKRDIAFALTVYYGEPTIYVDDNIEYPNVTNARWREVNHGSNVVGLTECDSEYYYIAIKGGKFAYNLYSLLVRSYDPVAPFDHFSYLYLNQPVNDVLVFNSWNYYSFWFYYYPATEVPPELSIFVSERVGSPEIYVTYQRNSNYSNYPTTDRYDYKADKKDSSNIVSIYSPPVGYYYIGVKADARNTQYQIVASAQMTNSSSLPMVDGYVYPGAVGRGTYNYYSFNVPSWADDSDQLTFTVHSLVGRCGIFVSDKYVLPNSTAYNWSSSTVTNEMVVISKSNGRLHGGIYYLSVYGYNNCSYTASASFTSRYQFSLGTSVTGYLEEEQEQFMMLSVPYSAEPRDLTLTLSNEFGSCYLYVSRDHDPDRGEYDYQWASEVAGAHAQTVKIDKSVCSNTPTNASCTFYILIFAVQESNYLIHAFYSNGSQPITSGQLVSGSLAQDDYNFYSIDLPGNRMNVTITLTPVGAGNPDLYVNRWSYVTADEYLLKSETNGVEQIYFDWTTKAIENANGMRGLWYIAVYANTACSYNLRVIVGDRAVTTVTLVNGHPIADDVVPGETRQFTFTLSRSGWPYDVTVAKNTITGYSTMVVITPDNTVLNQNRDGIVSISSDYDHACNPNTTNCVFKVNITAPLWSMTSRYLLTYSTSHIPTNLISGYSTSQTRLDYGDYEYYLLTNPGKGDDILFALSVMEGNPVMYISTTEVFPSSSNNNWTSTSRLIGLTNQDADVFYVAVHAELNNNQQARAVYTLLARVIDPENPTPTYLEDGRPVLSAINANVYDYFIFYTYPDSEGNVPTGITIQVNPDVGSPNVYVKITDTYDTPYPSKTDFDFASQQSGSNAVVTIPKASVPTDFTYYYVAVLSSQNSEYTITVMENDAYSYIGDGYEMSGAILPDQYHYYRYYVSMQYENVTWSVSATASTGSITLYVSDVGSNMYPKTDRYNWTSAGTGTNTVRLTPSSNAIHRGYYYIGVYCSSTTAVDCLYSIVVNYASSFTLTDGNLYEGLLGGGGTRMMRYILNGVEGDGSTRTLWELLMNTFTGRGELYISGNPNKVPDYGDASSYDWSSKANSNVQRIDLPETSCDNAKQCVFLIQLYCPTRCSYMVQAASANSSLQLSPGKPVPNTIPSWGIYEKTYRFDIRSEKDNVTVNLELSTSGRLPSYPHIYIGLDDPEPTQNSSDFDSGNQDSRVQTVYFDYTNLPAGKTMKGTGYVTVMFDTSLGDGNPIPYLISVQTSDPVPFPLSAGVSAGINLLAGKFVYYQFQIPRTVSWPYNAFIQLRASSGSADMYVRNGFDSPAPNQYQWKLENVNTNPVNLSIYYTDDKACSPSNRGTAAFCTYTILVVARENGANVRILADTNPPDGNEPESGSSGSNGGIIAAAIIVPLVAIVAGVAIYYYCCRGRSFSWSWSSSSSKEDDFFGSHIEMNEAGTRGGKKGKRGQTFNRLLDDADSDYARGGADDGGSYRPPRL